MRRPVSEIFEVEWRDSGDVPVLCGQFTGIGVCEHLVGTVAVITPTGFTLEIIDELINVVTTDATRRKVNMME